MGIFSFLKKEEKKLPPLPDIGSLPPLPTMDAEKPSETAHVETKEEKAPSFPEIPKEDIPEKIPDLEEIPEPPKIKPVQVQESPQIGEVPEHIPQLEGFESEPFVENAKETIVKHRTASGPLFVRMDKYKVLLSDIENMKNNFKQNENIYTRLNDYRVEQDKKFELFHESLEDIQRKLLFMDKTLFEAE
jgi:hypothetical protein